MAYRAAASEPIEHYTVQKMSWHRETVIGMGKNFKSSVPGPRLSSMKPAFMSALHPRKDGIDLGRQASCWQTLANETGAAPWTTNESKHVRQMKCDTWPSRTAHASRTPFPSPRQSSTDFA